MGGNKPKSFNYDLICLGSGSGGGLSALLAARAGYRVALVEGQETLGGSSPTKTCIPFNALLQFVKTLETVQRSAYYGINIGRLNISWQKVLKFKEDCIKQTGAFESQAVFEKNGVEIISGFAQFTNPWTITVNRRNLTAKRFIIATGGKPHVPNVSGISKVDFATYKTALDFESLPKSVFIIGAGETGCALAEFFNACNSQVYLADESSHLLKSEDLEVSQIEAEILKNKGVSLYLESQIMTLAENSQKQKVVAFSHQGERKEMAAEKIILAAGVRPNFDLNLPAAGVEFDEKGIKVNSYLESSMAHIQAIGDVVDLPKRTPAVNQQARLIVHNLGQRRQKNKLRLNPKMYTRYLALSPEVAACGLTEKELLQQKTNYRRGLVPIHKATCSYLTQQRAGFLKLLSAADGRLLGASMIIPHAGEIVSELSLALRHNLTVADLKNNLKAFPTWSEILNLACQKML